MDIEDVSSPSCLQLPLRQPTVKGSTGQAPPRTRKQTGCRSAPECARPVGHAAARRSVAASHPRSCVSAPSQALSATARWTDGRRDPRDRTAHGCACCPKSHRGCKASSGWAAVGIGELGCVVVGGVRTVRVRGHSTCAEGEPGNRTPRPPGGPQLRAARLGPGGSQPFLSPEPRDLRGGRRRAASAGRASSARAPLSRVLSPACSRESPRPCSDMPPQAPTHLLPRPPRATPSLPPLAGRAQSREAVALLAPPPALLPEALPDRGS
ncbi:hypothetical protein H8959_003522 [Pygathrix nigripes]